MKYGWTRVGRRIARLGMVCAALAVGASGVAAQDPNFDPDTLANAQIELSLEQMVEFALNSSYQVRRLNIDVQRSRLNLEASRARLRSRVDLDFTVPRINAISETRWNSELQRNVISRENSRRFQLDLAVRQPVILFGFPTNGYLSLTNRIYRLRQAAGEDSDIRYYNRAFVAYTQPLFQANELKNDLERAEMNLERQELGYYGDIVRIIDNTSDDYFRLVEIAWDEQTRSDYVSKLERALELAREAAADDPDRQADVDQIMIELANARETLTATQSRWRLTTSSLKTEFGLPQSTVLSVEPEVALARIPIDTEQAVRYAMELAPRVRELGLNHREQEIRLDETRGRGGFELDVSLSYGREMQDELLGRIWDQPENSYTVDVAGSLPIWDWGERRRRIESAELNVERSQLQIEESTADIENAVRNEVRNVAEFEDRAFNMQSNLELARSATETTFERYTEGATSALDLLQSLRRELDTSSNFLDTYLGWRRALQRIQEMTYYDFEAEAFILDRFGISFADAG